VTQYRAVPSTGCYDSLVGDEREEDRLTLGDEATLAMGAEVVPQGELDRIQAVARGRLFGGDSKPAKIGRFEVIERLGSGGMGIVYAARDPDLERKVAIKVLRGTCVGERAQARILREAQAIARVRHPNVIHVYETGSHQDEVYLAMEYVEGQTLRQWQDGRELDEVLAAYRAAGRGLGAAHRAGLTHRDFKPDNVLVDGEGHVRVLDFGLARGSGSEPTEDGLPTQEDPSLLDSPITATGTLMGTPAYMSPEQARGGHISPRADQFSFCAALWEAIYGTRPFASQEQEDFIAALRDGVVPDSPPVDKAPRKVERALRRGLAHEPSERFESMDDLLSALPRDHLESRRHHWRLAGISTVLVLGFGALNGIRAGQLDDDTRCPDAARYLDDVWDEASRKALKDHFYEHEQPYTDVAWGRTSEALDAHADAWVIAYSTTCDALVSTDNRDPELLEQGACLRWRLEELSTTIEVLTNADPLLLSEATSIVAQLRLVDECEDPATAQQLLRLPDDPKQAGAVQELRMRIASANGRIRAREEAEAQEALQSVVDEARELDHQPVLAEALLAFGNAHRESDRDLAEASMREAIDVAGQSGHDVVGADAWLSLVEHLHAEQQRMEEAAALLPAAQFAVRRVEGPRRRARVEAVWAGLELRRANYDSAHEHYARGIEILEAANYHDDPLYAGLLSRVAGVELERLNFDTALELAEKALEVAEYVHGPGHPATLGPLANAAGAHVKLEHLEQARAYYEEMLAAWRTVHDEDKTTAFVIDVLGVVDERENKLDDALRRATKALEIRQRVLVPHHVELGASHHNVGNVLRRQGKLAEAREHFAKAVEIHTKGIGAEHPLVAQALTGMGEIDRQLGKLESAHDALESATKVFTKAYGAEHPQTLEGHVSLAMVDEDAGRHQEALEGFEAVLKTLGDAKAAATRARAEFGKARVTMALERDPADAARLAAAAETHAREAEDEILRADIAAWRADL